MTSWKYTHRMINGKRRRVKVKHYASSGRTLVRMVGHINRHD